jgi:multiple sugar transport system substrate-binding protein
MFWAHGGREIDEAGTVAINSPETFAAVKAMKDAWNTAFDEAGLAWDDTSESRAFLAGSLSATLTGGNAWLVAQQENSPFLEDIALGLLPAGPRGQFLWMLTNCYSVMKASPNVEAAKAFIRWSMQDSVWMPWFEQCAGCYSGVGEKQDNSARWAALPTAVQVLKGAGKLSRAPGWPGPFNQKAGLAQHRYVIVDMFARAIQGESPEAAVAWAENQLKQVYT